MSECFLGEIRMFAGNYAPQNWLLCNGQLLNINGNEALFTLLGTTYGGDGNTTFALPDLRGRVPIHKTPAYPLGVRAGSESVTLLASQLPAHTHAAAAQTAAGTTNGPGNAYWAANPANSYSTTTTGLTPMSATAIAATGASQAHENMMPYLAVSFIIATAGIFPSQQ